MTEEVAGAAGSIALGANPAVVLGLGALSAFGSYLSSRGNRRTAEREGQLARDFTKRENELDRELQTALSVLGIDFQIGEGVRSRNNQWKLLAKQLNFTAAESEKDRVQQKELLAQQLLSTDEARRLDLAKGQANLQLGLDIEDTRKRNRRHDLLSGLSVNSTARVLMARGAPALWATGSLETPTVPTAEGILETAQGLPAGASTQVSPQASGPTRVTIPPPEIAPTLTVPTVAPFVPPAPVEVPGRGRTPAEATTRRR